MDQRTEPLSEELSLKSYLLSQKSAEAVVDEICDGTLEAPLILSGLITLVTTETSGLKFTCTKIIRLLSEREPVVVYPYFDDISKWLSHSNSFIKWDGIRIIANLVKVDSENRFDAIFGAYFDLLFSSQMITAANVIGGACEIIKARPEQESEITLMLLKVPQTIFMDKGMPSPECNAIACGHLITCFENYYDRSSHQAEIMNFVREQLNSPRNAVVKKAERFVKNHSARA